MKVGARAHRYLSSLLLLLVATQMWPDVLEAGLSRSPPDCGSSVESTRAGGLVVFLGPMSQRRPTLEAGRQRIDTLSLSDAVRTALSNSPQITAAQAGVSAESGARWADWGSLLPDLRSGADFARIEGTRITFEGEEGTAKEVPESISFIRKGARQSVSLHWTLLEGGSRYFRIKEGGARKRAATQRLARRERVVVARVKRVYFEALKQQKLRQALERRLEARQKELARTRQRHEAGSVGRLDLLGARKEVREARVRVLDARRRATEEIRRLLTEMGVDADEPAALLPLEPVELPRPDGLNTEDLVERALSTDPELKVREAERQAASAAAGESWTRYLPDVELSYGKLRSEVGGPESDFFKFSPRDDFSQLALSVSWRLFDGFERREQRARARAAEQIAQAGRRARRLELDSEVRSRVEEVHRRFDRVEELETVYSLAKERMNLARMRYEADRLEFDRYQAFIDDVAEAETAFFEERYEYLKAWVELEEMTGDLDAGP